MRVAAVLSLLTSDGAVIGLPARMLTGLRTTCPALSLQVSEPNFHSFLSAVVRCSVTVNDLLPPAGIVSVAGFTVALKPATAIAPLYVASFAVTFFTVRVTVIGDEPSTLPTVIDGRFRL